MTRKSSPIDSMGSRLFDAFQHVAYRMDGSRGNHMGVIITLLMGMTLAS